MVAKFYMAALLSLAAGLSAVGGQQIRGELGDLTQAVSVEIRDGSGMAVLTGTFRTVEDDEDAEIEKRARLTGPGDARGEVDLEIDGNEQELEVEVRGLAPNQEFSVWIDGRRIGQFKTDSNGRADVEWLDR